MATDEDTTLTWTADFSDLESALSSIQGSANEAFSSVEESAQKAADALGGDLPEASEKAQESIHAIHEESQGLGEKLEEVRNMMRTAFEASGAALAYETVKSLAEQVLELGEHAEQLRNYAQVVQLTVEQFQGLTAAAEETGVGANVAERGMIRFVTMLHQARDGSSEAILKLQSVGITLADIQNPAFGTAGIIARIGEALSNSNTEIKAHENLLQILGPRYALLGNVLEKLQSEMGGLEGAYKSVDGLNKEQNDALAELAERWTHLKEVVHNFFAGLAADATISLSSTESKISTLQYQLDNYINIARNNAGNAEGTWATNMAAQVQAKIDQLKGLAEQSKDTAIPGGAAAASPDAAITAADLESAATRKIELDDLKFKIQLAQEGSEAKVAAVQAYYDRVKELEGANSSDARAAAQQLTEAQKSSLDNLSAYVKETSAGVVTAIKEDDKDMETAYKEMTAVIVDEASAGLKQQSDDYELLAKEANATYQQIAKKYDDIEKAITKSYDTAGKQIGNSLASAFDGMITKSETFQQALLKLGENLAQMFIKDATQAVTHWVAMELAKTAISTTEAARRAALQESTASEAVALEAGAAKKSVLSSAASAAAATFQSVSQIPYVGWLLAPAAAAGAFAATLAFGSEIPSAAGGFEVPEDMLAYVHKDEKVLPASISKGLTNLIQNGGANSGSGGGGNHIHLAVQAWDHESVKRWARNPRNQDELAKAFKGSFNRGNPSTRP